MMSEEKKETAYEDLRKAVDAYGEHGEEDFLTDSEALADAKALAEQEAAVSHGHRLRATRESRGFTLQELAEKTGIPADLLGQVEAGESILPLGQLIKLSKALAMRMADVISEGDQPFTIVRSHQRRRFARFGKARQANHGYEYEALAANKKDRRMEPFIVTLQPASSDEPSTHDGQEFIYVLEGEMEALVDDTREVLGPGDAIYYDSTSMHLVRAHGNKPARILAVLIS
ncbi:MAG: helix-turn-helix domain-containing protein [Deltaproteobacteria bacterium]|nr:helix-turn-helix domain-containing protein [Deltaproteobacteria bacterium]